MATCLVQVPLQSATQLFAGHQCQCVCMGAPGGKAARKRVRPEATHSDGHAGRPKAEDVFFQGKSREIKTLTSILSLMVKSGEQACLQAYIASRQQAVATMLQLIATTVDEAVPSAAHAERRIHECAFLHDLALASGHGVAAKCTPLSGSQVHWGAVQSGVIACVYVPCSSLTE